MLMKYLFKIDFKKVISIPNVYQSTFTMRKFLRLNLGIHRNWCLKYRSDKNVFFDLRLIFN